MRFNFEQTGMTGGLVEDQIFGKPKETLSYKDFLNSETERKIQREKRTPLKDQLNHVRNIQQVGTLEIGGKILEKGPTHPQKYFAGALRRQLAKELDWPDNYVRFYTSVNTELDYAYGIDAFIDIVAINEDGKEVVLHTITLDVTNRTQKAQDAYGKADVVFGFKNLDPREDKQKYMEFVEDIAFKCMQTLTPEVKEKAVFEYPLANAA